MRSFGYIFISYQRLSYTMNAISWYRYLMVFILVLAGLTLIQPCFADTNPVPGNDIIPLSGTTPVPDQDVTAKATIAPIHTKEPEVKPPVENPQPGETPTTQPTIQKSSPVVTGSVSATSTPTPSPTPGETGNNETSQTYFQWGRAYQDVGNCKAAIDEYDKAIARDPYYADAWYYRAICYEKLGMYDEAYDSYRFLLTIDPEYFSDTSNDSRPSVTSNISLRDRPPFPGDEVPFMASPLFWMVIGIGFGGLIISGLVIYHIRKRPAIKENQVLSRQSSGPVSDADLKQMADQVAPYYPGDRDICILVLKLAIEIAREGREGKPIGTAFVLGDSDAVMERSRQLILNPLAGHSEMERNITNPDMRENLKELALLDGAFVIREDGTVEAAGRYISIDTGNVQLSKGFGTRHVSVAAITQETKAIGIVVSESGGQVRIMAQGRIILETN